MFVYRDGAWDPDPLNVIPAWPSDDIPSNLPSSWLALFDSDAAIWRNSYHWTAQQYASVVANNATFAASGDPMDLVKADYLRARYRHWLHGRWSYEDVVDTLSHERPASADGGATLGPTTWYDYPERWDAVFAGTSRRPTLIARRMLDGDFIYGGSSTWATRLERDEWGNVTNRIERWYDLDASEYRTRTNSYQYVNDHDLRVHRGPDGAIEAGYSYDAAHPHLPVAVTNAVGEITRYYYDSAQRLIGVARPSGLNSTNLFGQNDFLQYAIDFMGTTPLRTNSYTWSNGQVLTHTDPRGLTLTYTRDALGRPTRIDYSDDSSYELFSYTRAGDGAILPVVTYHRDRRGGETYYTYAAANRLDTVTDPLGRVTAYSYCTCGSPSQVTRGHGTPIAETTTYDHDQVGRLRVSTTPDGVSTTNTYDALGRLFIRSDAVGSITNWYDNLGRLHLVQNAAGDVQYLEYDDDDRVQLQVDANGVTITNAYDALGRLRVRGQPDGGKEYFGYTANVAAMTSHTNQVGDIVRYAYDAAGRKTNEILVGIATNRFTYGPADDLLSLTDGRGLTKTWSYLLGGRVRRKYDQNNLLVLQDVFIQGIHRQHYTAAKGTTVYNYDAAGNLTNINYPGTVIDVTLQYDALNRMTNMIDGVGTTAFTYWPGGRLQSETGPWASNTVTWGYTNSVPGLLSSLNIQQPAGSWTQSYVWDAARRLTNLVSPAGTFTYYHGEGVDPSYGTASTLIEQLSLPNGSRITNTFDSVARLLSTKLINSGGYVTNAHSYLNNAAHQRTRQTRTDGSYVTYTYDAAGQLATAAGTGGQSTENLGFGYDPSWNVSSRTNSGTPTAFTVGNKNELTNGPDGVCTWDNNGNLLSSHAGARTYAWDAQDRMTMISHGTSWRSEFSYDGQSRLRRRMDYTYSGGWVASGETRYLYDGMRIVQERDASNVPTVTYTRGLDLSGTFEDAGGIGGLLARSHGYSGGNWSSHSYYHADGNGNVTRLSNAGQAAVATYRYDPFGNTTYSVGSLAAANTMRFSSKPVHVNSGLYDFGYRWYSPNMQRWVSRDPIAEIAGANLFAYLLNRPIDLVDSWGLFEDGYNGKAKPGQYKGHSDFCGHERFDWTAEDHDRRTSPLNLFGGTQRHFQDYNTSLGQVASALADCNKPAFERAMHRLQDYYSHYEKGYRWWGYYDKHLGPDSVPPTMMPPPSGLMLLGHVGAGHEPDRDNAAWDRANKLTCRLVKLWEKDCGCPKIMWLPRESGPAIHMPSTSVIFF